MLQGAGKSSADGARGLGLIRCGHGAADARGAGNYRWRINYSILRKARPYPW